MVPDMTLAEAPFFVDQPENVQFPVNDVPAIRSDDVSSYSAAVNGSRKEYNRLGVPWGLSTTGGREINLKLTIVPSAHSLYAAGGMRWG